MFIFVGFFVYFSVIALISFLAFITKQKGSEYSSVILGNRSVNYVLTALSAHASDMSDWLFMAFPATLYSSGLCSAWIAVGLVGGMWLTWQFIAPRLRTMTEKYHSLTLSTYFERRFGDTSGRIRITSAFISLFFFAVYIAAGLKGFGFLAESVFELSYATGIFFAVTCATFYILFGGYRSLAWIDAFQATFLLAVIFFVPVVGYGHVGGWSGIVQAAALSPISLSFFSPTFVGNINNILLACSWGVGYFGTPHILTKFMGISHPSEMKKAQWIGMTWQVLVLSAAGMAGLIGIPLFLTPLQNKELVFVEMVKLLCSPLLSGFILSAVAGATLSVITAQALVLVSVLTEDVYKGTLRPRASEKELLWVYRVSIFFVFLLSLLVSLNKELSIQQLVYYAWMGFGASFGPLVLLSLYTSFINMYGALACMIVGSAGAALWHIKLYSLIFCSTGLKIPAVLPGGIASMAVACAISLLTKKSKKETFSR